MQGFNMGRHRPYDSDPSKQSFNSHSGKHPLGDRARKLDRGILIVRFENPFNIWCDSGCLIPQGRRFNAEKSKVGNYLSTPIWNFRCKCQGCQNWFEIRTDPKNTQYICHSGARRKIEDWDPEEEGNGAFIADTEAGLDRAPYSLAPSSSSSDPFSNLESKRLQKSKKEKSDERLYQLEQMSTSRNSDPLTLNAKLRDFSRAQRHESIRKEMRDDDLRGRIGWRNDLELRDEAPEDLKAGRLEWLEEKDKQELASRSSEKLDVGSTSSAFHQASKRSKSGKRKSLSSQSPTNRKRNPDVRSTFKPSLSSQPALSLASKLSANSRKKRDPFGFASSSKR